MTYFLLGFAMGAFVILKLERRLRNGTSDFPAEDAYSGNHRTSPPIWDQNLVGWDSRDSIPFEAKQAGVVSDRYAGKD